jgi:hypothetical protein
MGNNNNTNNNNGNKKNNKNTLEKLTRFIVRCGDMQFGKNVTIHGRNFQTLFPASITWIRISGLLKNGAPIFYKSH